MVGTVFIETFWLNETRTTPKFLEIYLSWAFWPNLLIYLTLVFSTTLMSCVACDPGESAAQVFGKEQKLTQMRSIGHVEQHVLPKFKYTFNSSTTLFSYTCMWWYLWPGEEKTRVCI